MSGSPQAPARPQRAAAARGGGGGTTAAQRELLQRIAAARDAGAAAPSAGAAPGPGPAASSVLLERSTNLPPDSGSSGSSSGSAAGSPPPPQTKATTGAPTRLPKTPAEFTPNRRRLFQLGKQSLTSFRAKRDATAGPLAGGGAARPAPAQAPAPPRRAILLSDSESESEEEPEAEAEAAGQEEEEEQATPEAPSQAARQAATLELLDSVLGSLALSPEGEATPGPPEDPPEDPPEAPAAPVPRAERPARPSPLPAPAPGAPPAAAPAAPAAFRLPGDLERTLYAHQRAGVAWLWGLHEKRKGGILGDDMGLGKTMQVAAFLAGLAAGGHARRVLVVAPKTLLFHWMKELEVCGLADRVRDYFQGTPKARDRQLDRAVAEGGVVLTTYGLVRHNGDRLSLIGREDADQGPVEWDWLVMDEGHVVKNPKTEQAKQLRRLRARRRLIVSGTPIQNNLQELHTLFDFVCPGLLGDKTYFKHEFERPILIGQDKHASAREREVGHAVGKRLRQLYMPYLLRRVKGEVFGKAKGAAAAGDRPAEEGPAAAAAGGDAAAAPDARAGELGHKNDLIVWLKPTELQQKLYLEFLKTGSVRRLFDKSGNALAAMNFLKRICDHPHLLKVAADSREVQADAEGLAAARASSAEHTTALEDLRRSVEAQRLLSALDADAGGCSDATLAASCKTAFAADLLRELTATGHRTLVFSQSLRMLDFLEAVLRRDGLDFCRIDGGVTSAARRQAEVARFQEGAPGRAPVPVFLLTSGVGGLGLTLTEADRVVILDPNWNPAVDNQSVDRAYRIGQRRNVVVYRLITCGTIEEKMYTRQVFKQGLSLVGTVDADTFKYCSHRDMGDLFRARAEDFRASRTQAEMNRVHRAQRVEVPGLREHLAGFVEAHARVAGVSDHDLLFSKPPEAAPEAGRRGAGAGGRGGYVKLVGEGKAWANASPALKKKIASQGRWTGSVSISAMLERQNDRVKSTGKPAVLQASLRSLEEQVRRQEALLANAGLQLPDGGQKVRAKLDELRAEVAEKRRLLAARTPQGAGAGPPAGSADAFAAGGGAPKRLAFGEGEDPLEPVGEAEKDKEAADALDAALSGLAL